MRHPAVFVQGAKVGGYAFLFFEADVEVFLFAEHDAAALGAEEGEFVEGGVGEGGLEGMLVKVL